MRKDKNEYETIPLTNFDDVESNNGGNPFQNENQLEQSLSSDSTEMNALLISDNGSGHRVPTRYETFDMEQRSNHSSLTRKQWLTLGIVLLLMTGGFFGFVLPFILLRRNDADTSPTFGPTGHPNSTTPRFFSSTTEATSSTAQSTTASSTSPSTSPSTPRSTPMTAQTLFSAQTKTTKKPTTITAATIADEKCANHRVPPWCCDHGQNVCNTSEIAEGPRR